METVRVVVVEARPTLASPEADHYAGAFISIYTTASSESAALRIAAVEVADAGWLLLSVENAYCLTRDEAEATPEAHPYYEQALIDGVVLVFDTYPHGG